MNETRYILYQNLYLFLWNCSRNKLCLGIHKANRIVRYRKDLIDQTNSCWQRESKSSRYMWMKVLLMQSRWMDRSENFPGIHIDQTGRLDFVHAEDSHSIRSPAEAFVSNILQCFLTLVFSSLYIHLPYSLLKGQW